MLNQSVIVKIPKEFKIKRYKYYDLYLDAENYHYSFNQNKYDTITLWQYFDFITDHHLITYKLLDNHRIQLELSKFKLNNYINPLMKIR